MDDLGKMISFLKDTGDTLQHITGTIDTLMNHYNTNFNSVTAVRNDEYRFLEGEYFTHPELFPEEIHQLFRKEHGTQDTLYRKKLDELHEQLDTVTREQKKVNKNRDSLLDDITKKNRTLDTREEVLKKRIAGLDTKIDEYNRTIDTLNSGLGFLMNFFRMRKIQKTKEDILGERAVLIEEIEEVRDKWLTAHAESTGTENTLIEEWNNNNVQQSILAEKIRYLHDNRPELVNKAALHAVLTSHPWKGIQPEGGLPEDIPASCTVCGLQNTAQQYFCRYCGSRFAGDRTDVSGSLTEIGELNEVYTVLETGMKQSVSFLALMKGILQGTKEFVKSVSSVKASQDQYSSLPALRIAVPETSAAFAEKIKELSASLESGDYERHPLDFSDRVREYSDSVFTEKNISQFFNAMGEELNKATGEQW